MTAMNIQNAQAERVNHDLKEVVRLAQGDLYCLPYGALNVRVLSGTAWITAQAEDHVLEADDELMIPRQPHAVIVSAVGGQPLSFEFRR
ncbi:MAG: DUF2917 domain-containing protein [Chloroflexota bacterium]